MKIAMLSPISWRTPPRHYGPWEQVVSLLTEGLVRKGIDVTLFATADSVTSAALKCICPSPCEEDPTLDPKVWESLHISHLMEQAACFDLIHNHYDFLPLTYSKLIHTPMLTTIHGFSSDRILPVYRKYNRHVHYVSISSADRSPDLDYIATVYHGIVVEDFPFNPLAGDYLLFFGRIHPEKGVKEAIDVARKLGMKLLIAGVIQDKIYFQKVVEPELDHYRIRYLGSVGPDRRGPLLAGARALIHLINFDEPFGLSLVEAMACGTPVVARPRGSIPEVVVHGETGFHATDIDAAVAAVKQIHGIDRHRCRAWVQERFHRDRMVEGYMYVYSRILSGEDLYERNGRQEQVLDRRELLAHPQGHGDVEGF
ncbi:MAG: glycosyltransferase family 4 protein [Syntrophales bacterium]